MHPDADRLVDQVLDGTYRLSARIGEGVYKALSVEASVAARASHGGTAPDEVRKRIAEAREALENGA